MRSPLIRYALVSGIVLPLWVSVAAGQPVSSKGPTPATTTLQGFSVVLVSGSTKAGPSSGASDEVPPAAQRALADMKDFLPYKSYRLLDTAWLLNPASARSRIRGPEGRDFEVTLAAAETPANGVLKVSFELREAGAGPVVSGSADVTLRWREVTAEIASMEARVESLKAAHQRAKQLAERKLMPESQIQSMDAELSAQLAGLEQLRAELRGLSGAGSVIATEFAMTVGETVVVGTSRTGGDSALIALLTAVPRGKK